MSLNTSALINLSHLFKTRTGFTYFQEIMAVISHLACFSVSVYFDADLHADVE